MRRAKIRRIFIITSNDTYNFLILLGSRPHRIFAWHMTLINYNLLTKDAILTNYEGVCLCLPLLKKIQLLI